jgi:hypothetical protein
VLCVRDIKLKDFDGGVKFAGRALSERKSPTGAGEHDFGSFALRKLCDSKG